MAVRAPEIAIIGGSGLYDLDLLEDPSDVTVQTPFGEPSDAIVVGTLEGRAVAFLSRHGRGHRLTPTEIPAAANIYALKSLGVGRVVSVSAVGSLREDYAPGDMVVPDQIVDRTTGMRRSTFFGEGIVAHVSLADPYCPRLRDALLEAVGAAGESAHRAGTYVCIEGPQFSTRAESELYRSWSVDIIGMTALPEARLAREAGLCYATLALVTDYDCWRTDVPDVDAQAVADVMAANATRARKALVSLVGAGVPDRDCGCSRALADAIVTAPDAIPEAARERLGVLLGDAH